MAETVEETAVETAEAAQPVSRLCLCEQYVRVTEGAALTAARWLGRADQEAAERDAAEAMRRVLDDFPIDGRVVIGSRDEDSPLHVGSNIGAGGEQADLALDPLEGRGVVARGGNGAMSMIAVGERDSLLNLPDMYMRKLAVGPRARGSIDLLKPMGENVQAIADAFGRRPNDITTIVLDRPRHHDLIEDIRASGARIKLIQDGTVTASISAAIRGTNDHLAVGIGGTRQAIMSAAALRCLGGEVQAQLWPTSRREIEQAREVGIDDPTRVFTTEELASGEVLVAATGVSNGDLLRGVRFLADSARTHSLVMCTRCNWVRFTDGIHFFARERREEVRLLGYWLQWTAMPTREEVYEVLRQVEDPELGMDIVELGLLYDVEVNGRAVKVTHSLTSMGCPAGPMIQEDINRVAREVPGVEDVDIELTWDPPWTPERMSDDAKFILGIG